MFLAYCGQSLQMTQKLLKKIMKFDNYEKYGKRLFWVGVVFAIFFSLVFIFWNYEKVNPSIGINAAIWGQFGDIIGGVVGTIVALVGAFLLFETLKQQRNQFIKQQIETRFFELLKLHRENVAEMQSKGKAGRSVFVEIKDEFHDVFSYLTENYYVIHSENEKTLQEEKGRKKKNLIQIAYLIVFLGVNNSSTQYLKKKIKEIISDKSIYKNFEDNCLKHVIYYHENTKQKNNKKRKENREYLKYDGHQSSLGHYYRHLFQTVKYIDERKELDYKEKYNYIKTLRAQLGTHEQALFLYNAISHFGEPWELSDKITDENEELITKYNLIKNIPEGFTKDVNPKDYFPNIYYEFDSERTEERKQLEKKYR